MAKSLKEVFGLREMAVSVPDEHLPVLKKLAAAAAEKKKLPPDAASWFDPPGSAAQPSSPEPEKPAKAKGKKDEPAPRQPIPLSPDAKQALDKSQSAWDKLANAGVAKPEAPPSNVAPKAPAKPGMFDPSSDEIGFDDRQWSFDKKTGVATQGTRNRGTVPGWDEHPLDAPKSANVNLKPGKKPGALSRLMGKKSPTEPQPEPMAMQPKQGALSKLFGKGGPKIKAEPGDDGKIATNTFGRQQEPAAPGNKGLAAAQKKGQDFVDRDENPPEWTPGNGDSAMDDLHGFLQSTPHVPKAGGQGAMNDLDWDLKRARGKR